MQAVQHKISGLKCDTEGCDFRDDSVKFDEYKKHIGRPCPKCGANLLTQEDADLVERIIAFTEVINKAYGELPEDTPVIEVKMGLNGTGTLNPTVVSDTEAE